MPLDGLRSQAVTAWKALEPVKDAWICPDRHTGSARAYQGEVLDRLAEVLDQSDERSLRALARHLCADPKPLGDPVTIVCGHGSHNRPRGRKAIGFQHWLLTTKPWLPTGGGPGGRQLRVPQDIWTEVPAGPPRSVLPSPPLPISEPAAVGLNSTYRPAVDRLEAAMLAVQEAFPQLNQAPPEVQEGAAWLLRKLDAAAAKQSAGVDRREPVPLPARQTGATVWSLNPVIADLPGAEEVPGVAWLAAAPWTGLQRCYKLERASAVVKADVAATVANSARPLLTRKDRVHLLALLIDRGGEPGSLAFRLGNLDEQRVTSLEVTYRTHGRTWLFRPAYHLEPRLNARSRLQGADLRSLVDLGAADLVQLGHLLAHYLGVGESGDLIGQYLIVRDVLLTAHHILPTQLTEAGQALKRHRANEDPSSGASPSAHAHEEAREEATGPPDGEGSRPAALSSGSAGLGDAAAADSVAGAEAGDRGDQAKDGTGGDHHVGSSTPDPAAPGRNAAAGSGASGDMAAPAPRRESVRFGSAEHRLGGNRAARRHAPASGAPRTGERAGAGTTGGVSSADAADRRATEKAAEDVAISFLQTRYAAKVERVGDQNVGWDLTATLPDGNRLLVEVKGFAGRVADFVITRGELRAARWHAEYRVCVVTGVGSTSGELAWIEATAALVADDHLDPYQWIVLDWPRCDYESLPWSDQ